MAGLDKFQEMEALKAQGWTEAPEEGDYILRPPRVLMGRLAAMCFHVYDARDLQGFVEAPGEGAPNDATGCAPWIDSKKELPPGDVEMVLVCYVGLNNPQVEEGAVEVSRAEYVRDEPSAYPFWMLLPEPAKRPSQR